MQLWVISYVFIFLKEPVWEQINNMHLWFQESMYEWMKHPKIIEIDHTSVEVAKAAVYWHLELEALSAKFPFEGKQIVLIMKKKYRQYYQMIFKTLKAKTITYDPRYFLTFATCSCFYNQFRHS